jgi:hypothetical protein
MTSSNSRALAVALACGLSTACATGAGIRTQGESGHKSLLLNGLNYRHLANAGVGARVSADRPSIT